MRFFQGGYFNDTRITDAGSFDNAVRGTEFSPTTGASLWTTYKIQRGDLQGLGFGLGAFYVGNRVTRGFLVTEVIELEVPAYVRFDASLFYRQEDWDVQLNLKNLFDDRAYEFSAYGIVPTVYYHTGNSFGTLLMLYRSKGYED